MPASHITPILRIVDEQQAMEFYVEGLGFHVDWEHRAEGPLYMQISLGDVLLHLSQHSGDAAVGAAIKIHVNEIEAFIERLVARDLPTSVAKQYPGVAEQPWGSLDMLLVDPFGNRLIFTNADFAGSYRDLS